jgi:uncharacterized protein (DUF697 family)
VRAQALQAAPIIWLLGKTGAGKTSIIKALTGADRAKIGEGFSPCTRTASVFDFPDGAPLVRFLDTRGLEEAGYDPAEDLAFCANQSHFILATMRAMDPDQGTIANVIRTARLRHPEWPVVVAQTSLHQGYPRAANHAVPYPFTADATIPADVATPAGLHAALTYQRNLFAGLPGDGPVLFVALDFTLPEDGYTPVDYGLAALWDAIVAVAPHALAALQDAISVGENDIIATGAGPLILGFAFAAMAPAAVPVPFVDAAGIALIVAVMLRALAGRYNMEWTAQTFGAFTASLGGGILVGQLVRYGGRELLKLIPVYGQSVGLAMSAVAAFAVTYALGNAACLYLGYLRRGKAAPDAKVREAFAEALRRGFEQAARKRSQATLAPEVV